WWGRGMKYARRHPARAAVAGVGALAAAAILALASYLVYTLGVVGKLEQRRDQAQHELEIATAAVDDAEGKRLVAVRAQDAAEAETKAAQAEKQQAQQDEKWANYRSHILSAASALDVND